MFAKRIGDETLGVTPRARDVPTAVTVGERLPLLHKEGIEIGVGSGKGGGRRSSLGNVVVFGAALLMLVVCGFAMVSAATGVHHVNEVAEDVEGVRVPKAAGSLGVHVERVSLDAGGGLGANETKAPEEAAVPSEAPAMSTAEANCYLARYANLKTEYGTNTTAAKKHWKQQGFGENRTKSCDGIDEDDAEASAEAPEASVEGPESSVEAPQSSVEAPESSAEAPESSAEAPESSAEAPEPSAMDDDYEPLVILSPSGAKPMNPKGNYMADQKVLTDVSGNRTGTPGRLYLGPQDPINTELSAWRTRKGVLTLADRVVLPTVEPEAVGEEACDDNAFAPALGPSADDAGEYDEDGDDADAPEAAPNVAAEAPESAPDVAAEAPGAEPSP